MKIFVARLSQSTTSESLQMLLEQWGEVTSSKVIMDPQTGRSKCYGFVEMSDDEKAAQAIAELEGVEYEGSVITLKESVPHEEYKKTHPSTPAPQKQFRPRQVNYRPAQRKERTEDLTTHRVKASTHVVREDMFLVKMEANTTNVQTMAVIVHTRTMVDTVSNRITVGIVHARTTVGISSVLIR